MHLVHQNTSDRIYSHNRFKNSLLANGYPNVSLFNANPYDHETINLALGHPLDSIGETRSIMAFFGNCLANNLTTGIIKTSFKTSTYIYLNPSNTNLLIKTEDKNPLQYQITNTLGQVIQQEMVKGNSIDISCLIKGFYIIQLKDEKGQIVTRKFMKQ
jgi:hypothetical protein